MQNSKLRYALPNGVTFISLACGVAAILAAATGAIATAGALILASYVLDLIDGELARRLDATSEFGLQLDSLVDMVSLGAAPAVVAFIHLQAAPDVVPGLLWPIVIFYVLAGAFRLARFNLLPIKEGQTESVGLTISTSGATLTLAILSDVAQPQELVPNVLFLPFMLLLGTLMVSRLPHPPITWIFSWRWLNLLYVVYLVVTIAVLRVPFANVWFLFNGGYVGAALARAGYNSVAGSG